MPRAWRIELGWGLPPIRLVRRAPVTGAPAEPPPDCDEADEAEGAARRVLELRIHGVANTSPEGTLGVDKVRRVDGDEHTGFYRPLKQCAPEPVVTEAYSWGSLTSASRSLNQEGTTVGVRKDLQRALWMLLLPFAFANVAFWTRPRTAGPGGAGQWGKRDEDPLDLGGSAAWFQRLLCLGVTATFALAAVGAGVDLVGWQCETRQCLDKLPPLGFLEVKEAGGSWWSSGTRPLAVGLLAPVAAMLVLWWLAKKSFQYEAEVPIRKPGGVQHPIGHQMESRWFWSGEGQVRRLAALHLALGLMVACAAVWLATFLIDQGQAELDGAVTGAPSWYWGAGTGLALGVALIVVLWQLGRPEVTHRDGSEGLGPVVWVLALAAATCLAAVAYVLVPLRGVEDRGAGGLPGYGTTITVLFIAQFVGVVLLAGHSRSGPLGVWVPLATAAVAAVAASLVPLPSLPDPTGLRLDVAPDAGRAFLTALVAVAAAVVTALALPARGRAAELLGRDPRSLSRPAWGTRGPAIVFGIGWLLAVIYSVGALYRLADWLNGRQAPTEEAVSAASVQVPTSFSWGAFGVTLFVLLAATTASVDWVWLRRQAAELKGEVEKQYPPPPDADPPELSRHEQRRAREVARWWAYHKLVEQRSLATVGWLAVLAVPGIALGIAGAASGRLPVELVAELDLPSWLHGIVQWATNAGTWLATALVTGLIALGFLAYRNPSARQTVGIVWDIATFWPRAAHPLAPPCYSERAVPQLVTRVSNADSPIDSVILSGHSQGAVLAFATILQLRGVPREHLWLFTYGTQLNRLYGRAFPALFGPDELHKLAGSLVRGDTLRWNSLYRKTDPLGYRLDVTIGETTIDQVVLDPTALRPDPGKVTDPKIENHSNYQRDPAYTTIRDAAAQDLIAPPPSGGI
jgi:hypothetical protein